MKKTYKNILLSLCAISVLAGCASKDVEFDNASSGQASTYQNEENGVDNKLEQISGEETVMQEEVSSNNADNSSIMEDTMLMDKSDGINKVKSDVNGESVILKSVHFTFDKFVLTDDMRQIATSNATKIDATTQSYENLKIKLEGNCDEWGTDEYNYALGLKRAKTAKDALVSDGIDEKRIMMVSFGESNPLCTDRNVACWKLNRRVDYRLLP